MSVYIEYVIIDNMVINWLILLCVKNTLRLKSRWWQLLISAMIGTLGAVLMPLLHLSSLAMLPLKLALGVIMVLVLSRYLSVKEFVFSFLLFLAYTFLLGGACIATLIMFGTSIDELSSGGYDIALPIGIIMLIVCIYVLLIVSIAKYISRRRAVAPFVKKVVLCLAEHHMEMQAFMDSGNKLIDKKSGMPVIILSADLLFKHFAPEEVEALLVNNGKGCKEFKDVHTILYNTISGEAKSMVCFSADKLVISSGSDEFSTNRFMVGVTYKKFKDAIDYQMLLNPMVM